jgi:uncharacterized membrane protein
MIIPLFLLILILLAIAPLIFIYFFWHFTTDAFRQIGFGRWQAILISFGCLIGSLFNIPLTQIGGDYQLASIAVNVGGCLIPFLVSLEVILEKRTDIKRTLIGVAIIMVLTYILAQPVPGKGIVIAFYLPPLFAAICGIFLAKNRRNAPTVAYISGTMGTLLGADILHLITPNTISKLTSGCSSPPLLSIGGAGVIDGIFLTGVMAVFLASLVVHFSPRYNL